MTSRSWRNINVQYDRIIIIVLAIIITIPVVIKSRPDRLIPPSAAFFVSSSSRGYVCVSGDVRHPGIFPITVNMLTVDAINMAEPLQSAAGFIPNGCETFAVRNGTVIRVARNPGNGTELFFGLLSTAHRLVLGIPLDINAMTAEDFDLIPGVGPVLARRIVEYRQINGGKLDVSDLISIDGIGEKKYISLKKYFNSQ